MSTALKTPKIHSQSEIILMLENRWSGLGMVGRKKERKKWKNEQTNKPIKAIFVTLASIPLCCHTFISFQALHLSTTQVTFFFSRNS
jgi:hypothetical protein